MKSNKTFLIAPFGISRHESRVLQTICLISRSRPRTYQLWDAEMSAAADFAVVNHDDPQALAAWQAFQASHPMVAAVMLVGGPPVEGVDYQLGRPIMATRLLAILDKLEVSSESPAFARPRAVETADPVPSAQPPADQPSPAGGAHRSPSALVVDDSLPIRRQIELELAPFVGRVDLAEDGEQALESIASAVYDIVFLDVVLPGVDGYKICREIKRDKRTKDTPVIMLTGKSSPFDRVRGKLAGCDTYLTKPVDHATFVQVVEKYLRQRNAEVADSGDMPRQRMLTRA